MKEESLPIGEEIPKMFTILLTPERWQEICVETFAKTPMLCEASSANFVALLADFSFNLYKQLSLAADERGIEENGCAVDKD